MPFSEKLRIMREKAGITQRVLAERSGISQQAISFIEKGVRSPSESTMAMLAAGLGCSLSDMLDENEKSPPSGDGELEALRMEAAVILANLPVERVRQAVQYLRFLRTQK